VHALRDKREFTFHGAGWGDADALSFSRTLALCGALVYLNLSRNAIGDDGLGSLAAAFERGCAPSLKGLWLGQNAFGPLGLDALAMAVGQGLHEASSIAAKRRFGFWSSRSQRRVHLDAGAAGAAGAADVAAAAASPRSRRSRVAPSSTAAVGGRLQSLVMLDLSWNQFGRVPTAVADFVRKLLAGSLRSLTTLRLSGCFLGGRQHTRALLGEIEFARKATGALVALEEIVGIDPSAACISDDELDDEGGEGDPEDSLADLIEGVRLVKSAESGVSGGARAMSGALNVQ